jgi:four helix bundle protein
MPVFKNLRAWQIAKELSVECTKVAKGFPGGIRHPLGDQLLRAAYSVPLNIAEGSGRRGPREWRRYLDIARGSLQEVESALIIARELGYVSPEQFPRLDSMISEAGKTLWGLLHQVSERTRQ